MMRNGFYFKKKNKVNFKVYDVTTWEKSNLSNISRSEDNKTMKFGVFGQLIDNNMRNIVLEKSYAKCGGKTIL